MHQRKLSNSPKYHNEVHRITLIGSGCGQFYQRLQNPQLWKWRIKSGISENYRSYTIDEIVSIVNEYLGEDEQVQKAYVFVTSNEFKDIFSVIADTQEVRQLLLFLQDAGFEAYKMINDVNKLLGTPRIRPLKLTARIMDTQATGGIEGLLKDISSIIPMAEIKKVTEELWQNSKAFAEFVMQLDSPKWRALVERFFSNYQVKRLYKRFNVVVFKYEALKHLLQTIQDIHRKNNNVY